LFAGVTFQIILTLGIVPFAIAIGFVTSLGGLPDLLPSLPGAAPYWQIWGMGVTAHAHADADGVHWRYFLSGPIGGTRSTRSISPGAW